VPKVVILYNLFERLQKVRKGYPRRRSDHEEIEAVENAARSLGHQCIVMAVREEIFPIMHWLKEYHPMWSSTYVKVFMGIVVGDEYPRFVGSFSNSLYRILSSYTRVMSRQRKVKDILQSQGILTPRYKIFEQAVGL